MYIAPQLASYGMLGDGNTAALVSRDGAVDWWCAPRFDSPSVFGRLLDPDAGHWAIGTTAGADGVVTSRRYVEGTMVLATDLRTEAGAVELTDALDLGRAEPHALGRDIEPTLLRRVRGRRGAVEVEMDLEPRFDYGRRPARVEDHGEGIELRDPAGGTRLWLCGDRPVEPTAGGVRGRFVLQAGEQATFALRVGGPGPSASWSPDRALDDTIDTWRRWSADHDNYEGPYADEVRRSSLVLQALTYQPTGAVVAAPTTSLPEVPGGSANWDYRYAWLRDASLVLRALWVGACPDEAGRYFAWMDAAIGGEGADGGRLQIVYDVTGGRDLTETELPHLRGYHGSRPVRAGNDAWTQRQLDVPGEVLDAAWTLREHLDGDGVAGLVCRLADHAAATWTEPDAGIWEGREGERDYVSSKLMSWVALDRAVRLASRLGIADGDRDRWAAERERIRRRILADGWSERARAFTGAFGSDHLDASVLLMALTGFLSPTDERMASTIAAIEDHLTDGGLVRRWTGADDEGAFVMCSFWLAECHARAGRQDRAVEVFEQVTGHANDLGLLPEMIDPGSGELLGNHPQAVSHAALVRAAWSLGLSP